MRDDVEQCFQFPPIFIYDVSLRVTHMRDYVDQVNARLAAEFGDYKNFAFGHMGDGNLHFAISAGGDESAHHRVNRCVYEPLEAINGSISAEHGIGLEKKDYLLLSRSAEEVQLMQRLKLALDPNGILNPGKIFDAKAA